MEFHQPSKISLPSVRSILDEAPLRTGSSVERPCHLWPNPASTTSSLPYSHSNVAMSMTNNLDTRPDPTTPEQQRNASTGYPTPSSDDPPSDVEMDKGPSWSGAAKRPLFKVDESVLQLGDAESLASDGCTKPNLDLGFTPTIVHYRPNGIPNARSRKALGNSDSQKSRNRIISKDESGEETAKVRMVKWDRVTDKGTAPLNVEARTTGPRSCTLCHITKRRVIFSFVLEVIFSVIELMEHVQMRHIRVQIARRGILSVNLFLLHNCAKGQHSLRLWKA